MTTPGQFPGQFPDRETAKYFIQDWLNRNSHYNNAYTVTMSNRLKVWMWSMDIRTSLGLPAPLFQGRHLVPVEPVRPGSIADRWIRWRGRGGHIPVLTSPAFIRGLRFASRHATPILFVAVIGGYSLDIILTR